MKLHSLGQLGRLREALQSARHQAAERAAQAAQAAREQAAQAHAAAALLAHQQRGGVLARAAEPTGQIGRAHV